MTVEQSKPSVDRHAMAAYLAQQEDVIAAYLFGSVARDQAGRCSDVDVAVLLDSGLGAEESVERQLELMVGLDDFADREVQVTVLNRAPPSLAYRVIREGILLHERNRPQRVAFEVHSTRIYFDFKPFLERYSQALLKQIQEGGLNGRARYRSRALEAAQRIRERLAGTAER